MSPQIIDPTPAADRPVVARPPKAACKGARVPVEINERTLLGIEAFRGLPVADRQVIAQLMRGQRFDAGQQIVGHSDATQDVYFVITGHVRATFYSRSGRQVAFQDLEAGAMFGELAAIDGQPRSATVVALEETRVATLPHQAYLDVLARHRSVALALELRLSALARVLLGRIIEFSTLAVRNRVHAELLRLAKQNGADDGRTEVAIAKAPTHQEIADRISTHREAVSRELSDLERAGVIAWRRSDHRVLDVQRLREMVDYP